MLLPTQDTEARLTDEELHQCAVRCFINFPNDSHKLGKEIVETTLAKLEKLGYYKGLPPSIEEAMNSGDGAYRP